MRNQRPFRMTLGNKMMESPLLPEPHRNHRMEGFKTTARDHLPALHAFWQALES